MKRAAPRTFLFLLLSGAALAQQPPAAAILNYSHSVDDLDKSIKFYKDVFGLELSGPPENFSGASVSALVNAPGIKLRRAMFKIPGEKFGLELTQFSGTGRKGPVPEQFWPEHVYPGAADLQIKVRDMNVVFAALVSANARIITRSGQPVKVSPEIHAVSGPRVTKIAGIRAILVRDPDGYILHIIETSPPAGAPAGLVYGAEMGLTAEDLDKTKMFYHDILGFDFSPATEFSGDKAQLDLVGAANEKVQYREMTTKAPGTGAEIDFYEYRGIPRRQFHLHVYDPGAPALVLSINDLAGLVKRLKSAGRPIVSAKGEIVKLSPTTRSIFVVDPNGVNLELSESKQ